VFLKIDKKLESFMESIEWLHPTIKQLKIKTAKL